MQIICILIFQIKSKRSLLLCHAEMSWMGRRWWSMGRTKEKKEGTSSLAKIRSPRQWPRNYQQAKGNLNQNRSTLRWPKYNVRPNESHFFDAWLKLTNLKSNHWILPSGLWTISYGRLASFIIFKLTIYFFHFDQRYDFFLFSTFFWFSTLIK